MQARKSVITGGTGSKKTLPEYTRQRDKNGLRQPLGGLPPAVEKL
jgi:hypothetical protein